MNERKLKAKCVEMGMNIESISKAIGIDKSTFYRKMEKESFTIREANKISSKLKLTHDEVMTIFFSEYVADMRI